MITSTHVYFTFCYKVSNQLNNKWSRYFSSHIAYFFTTIIFWFLCLLSPQIKDDTRRQVYCALIRLLQDRDLCVRVWCNSYHHQYNFCFCSFLSFYHLSNSPLFIHLTTKGCSFCCFSWQLVGLYIFISKTQPSQRKIFLICFQHVGICVSNWQRKFRSLTQRYI